MSFRRYAEYRDSGVEWIGKVPAHWFCISLKSIDPYNPQMVQTGPFGAQLHASDYVNEGVPLVLIKNVRNLAIDDSDIPKVSTENAARLSDYRVEAGDIVFSRVGSIGRIAKITEKEQGWLISGQMLRLRLSSNLLNSAYSVYVLSSKIVENYIDYYSVGSTRESINTEILMNLRIPLSPLEEQKQIVAFLDGEIVKIDALIEKQEQLIKLLREKRQAIISRSVTKGLNPNAKMRDSDVEWLGEMPEHWEAKQIKYILLQKKGAIKTGPFGSQLTSRDMEGTDIKVINQRNVIDSDFDFGTNFINQEKYIELHAFTIFPGDILITTRGTIGRTAIAPNRNIKSILHPCLIRLQVDEKYWLKELVSLIIQSSGYFLEQLKILSNATTIDVIYSENLKNVAIVLPPTCGEQKKIIAFINKETTKIDTLIERCETAIGLLEERRTALIFAAVTGKIDVRSSV